MRTGRNRACSAPIARDAEPFTIVMPPPNVTGSLHIGHALDNTLQDVLIRHERLQGKDALWVVGTDHAGIATQMVVERQLERAAGQAHRLQPRRIRRQGVGVEGRERRRDHRPAAPARLLVRLGHERFTMDPHFSRAVVKVFVDLYNEGLIYRDKRLVNWDPKLKTAISRPRGRDAARSRAASGTSAIRSRTASGHDLGRDHAARDDARRHGGGGESRRRALRSADRQERPPADHRPRWSRSSPTSMPIPSSARARSRSRRAMTSTISRSASAPASSPAEMLNMLDARGAGRPDRRRPDPGRAARPRPLRRAQARRRR